MYDGGGGRGRGASTAAAVTPGGMRGRGSGETARRQSSSDESDKLWELSQLGGGGGVTVAEGCCLEMQSFTTSLPACWHFFITAISCGMLLEFADKVPVMVNSVSNTLYLNFGKFAGNQPWWVVNAGSHLHCGGAGAVSVMDFEEKLQL